MSKSFRNHADWRRFVVSVNKDLVPKMAGSSAVIIPMGRDDTDVAFALQVGFAVIMQKPLLLIVPAGFDPPPKLEGIADRIVRADYTSEEGRLRVQKELRDFTIAFRKQ